MFGGNEESGQEKDIPPVSGATPLAERMRPTNFDNFVGQKHLLGPGKPLRKLIESDKFGSLLLWGPPGSGKTTIASIAAKVSGKKFFTLSAVESGVKELKEVVKEARFMKDSGKNSVLFIDEIHRYNKTQQDALLPHVEKGLFTFIGATTENPSFGVIPALRSRCSVIELKPLREEDIRTVIANALSDRENGLGDSNIKLADDVVEQIALLSGGDARIALGIVEASAHLAEEDVIDSKTVEAVSQKAFLLYDRAGQGHYDHASAFQKSLRGSDPDASVYWLARMLEAGEDPRFIARRLIVTAAEDVGNADPTALILAVSAAEAVEKIGLPEGRIPLTQAVIYVALAPKSNSAVTAIDSAIETIRQSGSNPQVPPHLRDSSYKWHTGEKDKTGYTYPHGEPDNFVRQQYLPEELKNASFFNSSGHGREATLSERLREIKERNRGKS